MSPHSALARRPSASDSTPALARAVQAAIPAARRRAALARAMRQAFERNDTIRALELARQYCGIEP
jgi:hypothetical protein